MRFDVVSIIKSPWCCSAFVLLLVAGQCHAIDVALDKDEDIEEQRSGWLPYAFRTDSLGTAIGLGFFTAGRKQPQVRPGSIAGGHK